MKKLMLIILFSVPCYAGNPDQRASFGLQYSNGSLNGEGTMLEHVFNGKYHFSSSDLVKSEMNVLSIRPSFRAPMSDNLTVEIGITHYDYDVKHTGNFSKLKYGLKGEIFDIGFRYYLK